MSKTAHTPGPWEVSGQAFRVIAHFDGLGFWEIANATPTKITGDSGMIYDAGGDTEANARLIAAAPCLLEALEWCVNALEQDYKGSAPGCEIPADIRAAIARAKGEA